MATAEELLAGEVAPNEDFDHQDTLIIDNDLRTINIPSAIKLLGVESDEDVLRLNFRMPKVYGEVDLSRFEIRINYINAHGDGDKYVAKDNAVKDDTITFSWLVGRTATAYKGDVKFIVCLKRSENGEVVQEFNTAVASLPVLEGLETDEAIVQKNPDILEDILKRLDDLEQAGGTGGGSSSGENPAFKTVERTAAGTEVSLELRSGMATRSVSSNIEAVQSGEGIPYAAGKGKNLLPPLAQETTLQGVTFTPTDNGGLWVHGTCTASAGSGSFFHIPATFNLPAGNYCLSAGNDVAHDAMRLRLLDPSGNIIGLADMSLAVEDAWMLLEYGSARSMAQYTIRLQGGETYNVTLHPQLEAGDAVTPFAPYQNIREISGFDSATLTHNGMAYTQALGETVYGGVFNWTSGELTFTHGMIQSYAGETLTGEWISDRDAFKAGTMPTNGAQVVYALSEPRTVQLAAQDIEMVVGENTLFSDTGKTEIVYTVQMPSAIDDEDAREDRAWSGQKVNSRLIPLEQEISGEVRIAGNCAVIECESDEEITANGVGEVKLHHCGKNLINGVGGVGRSYTVNGVTYLILPNGTVRMTGTPTTGNGSSGSFFRIMRDYLPAGRYIFSSTKVLSPSSRYPILSYTIGGTSESVTLDGKSEAIFHLTEGTTVEVGLYNKADGYTIENEHIALQLERSDTQTFATEYEPYHGNIETVQLPVKLTAYGGVNVIFTENAEIDISMAKTIQRRIDTVIKEDNEMLAAYGLPILDLIGDVSAMSKENTVPLAYAYRERTGTCTLKWQGSSSIAHPKKNYTIKFDKAFEAVDPDYRYADTLDRKWGAQKKYVLKANYIDVTHSRNIVSARLWAEMVDSRANADEKLLACPNNGAIDGYPILVRLNGEIIGLYTMNIPKDGWMMGMGDGEREAIVCAEVTGSAGTTFTGTGTLATDFEIEYVPDENDTTWVTDSLARMINACVNSDGSDLDTAVAQYLDLESVIDYYIFAVMIRGTDILSRNYLLATYDGVKWFFTPYDLDSTFGLTWTGRDFKTAGNSLTTFEGYAGVTHADQVHRAMQLIWAHKKDALIARYKELRETVLSEAHVQDAFLNFAAQIPYCVYDMDRKIWPNIPASAANSVAQIMEQYRVSCDMADREMLDDNYRLIERIIAGYEPLASQPDDWLTNWGDYYVEQYEHNGNVMTHISGDTAPAWKADTYYKKTDDLPSMITRTAEPDGTPYHYSKMIIVFYAPAGTETKAGYIKFDDHSPIYVNTQNNGRITRHLLEMEVRNGRVFETIQQEMAYVDQGTTIKGTPFNNFYRSGDKTYNNIETVRIACYSDNPYLDYGTTIEIRGVRANA